MDNKRFLLVFFGAAAFVWSFSCWGYGVYMHVTHLQHFKRYDFMQLSLIGILSLSLTHIALQIRAIRKTGAKSVAKSITLNIAGLCFVCLYAFLVSVIQDNRWVLLSDFFNGAAFYPLKMLVPLIMAGEGLDVVFFFFLALISGYVIYSPAARFSGREFTKMLIIWFLIIFIDEMIIERFFLSYRSGSMLDVVNNMSGGVLIGLLLGRR